VAEGRKAALAKQSEEEAVPETITIDAQISELKREIALRKNVYRKWVDAGRLKQETADHQIAAMTAALHTLMFVEKTFPLGAPVELGQK
jgi:hypothetical protein